MPAAIAVVVALLAAGFLLTRGGGDEAAGGEIFLEPVSQPGPDPFTPSVAAPPPVPAPAPDPTAPETTVRAGASTAIQSTSGSRPGLYGGTRSNASCDKAQLVAFLQQNPDKATAFAAVVGIGAPEVPAYITGLTPVFLRGDTRVTNHGFANGKATPRQAVLQAGTGVLADDRGVPRVRCSCGNPLSPPTAASTAPTYTGKAWPAFRPTAVDVVAAAPAPVTALVLSDDAANTSFSRPVGTDGAADGPPGPPIPDPTPAGTTTTASTAPPASGATSTTPTTTVRANDVPLPNTDVTRQGSVQASSTFSPDFAAPLAVDGDAATSWLSGAPGAGGTSVFTWTGSADDLLTEVRIRTDAARGFGSVTVEVLDEFGDPDFSETVSLPGKPDPEVVVRPGVDGRTVRLTFRGHEDPSRSGIAELRIGATR